MKREDCVIDVAQDIRDRAAAVELPGPWIGKGGCVASASLQHNARCRVRLEDVLIRDSPPPAPGEKCDEMNYYGGHLICESTTRAASVHLAVWTPEFAIAIADLIDAALLGEAPDVAAARAVRVLMTQQPEAVSS